MCSKRALAAAALLSPSLSPRRIMPSRQAFFNSSDSSLPSDWVSTVTVSVLPLLLSFTSAPVSLASC
eukprot:scaffold79873_cov75-Phaeocystis_antarctica.AAC.2